VAPQPVESRLKQSELVENAVLIGDGRPYIVALIAPDAEAVAKWAREQGRGQEPMEQVLAASKLQARFAQAVDDVNRDLARFEQIKRFRVLPKPFTVDDGELTPTMKVKRPVVAAAYQELIDAMYEDGVV
jgi:long-chain acyl-CoA synthetase